MIDYTEPPDFDRSTVDEMHRRRIDEAKKSYEQAINRLWAGNAAGMFAVLGAFATGKGQGLPILAAVCAFVLGLAALSIGAFHSLLSQAKIIRELETVDSLLDLKPSSALRPSEEAGLTFSDFQTRMGIHSASLLFAGVIFGLCYAALKVFSP